MIGSDGQRWHSVVLIIVGLRKVGVASFSWRSCYPDYQSLGKGLLPGEPAVLAEGRCICSGIQVHEKRRKLGIV